MKKFILVIFLFASARASALEGKDIIATCRTDQNVEVLMTYHNWDPIQLISITVGGQDMTGKASGFSTTSGYPYLTLADFPRPGDSSMIHTEQHGYLVNYPANKHATPQGISCIFGVAKK